MLRKDIKMRIARDKRGYITTGNRGKEDNENPRSFDYFNLNDFPELQAVYGEKPTQILIVFPTDNIEDFYSTEYSLWGTGKGGMKVKKRACDGETCVDCITREESPCLCANLPERECKCYMELKAFIINPHTGTIINFSPTSFKTHSVNSADAIYSQLEQIWIMTGGKIRGIPFLLSVQMVEKLNEKSQKTKFPIWSIQVATDINRALQYAKIAALPTTEQNRLAIDATIAVDETPALPAGSGKQAEPNQPEPEITGSVISEKQRKRMFAIAKEHDISHETIKAIIQAYGYESTKDILVSDYEKICNEIAPEPPTLEDVAAGTQKAGKP